MAEMVRFELTEPQAVRHLSKVLPSATRAHLRRQIMAEDTGFEPADPLRSMVFKTTAFDHSANPPRST